MVWTATRSFHFVSHGHVGTVLVLRDARDSRLLHGEAAVHRPGARIPDLRTIHVVRLPHAARRGLRLRSLAWTAPLCDPWRIHHGARAVHDGSPAALLRSTRNDRDRIRPLLDHRTEPDRRPVRRGGSPTALGV